MSDRKENLKKNLGITEYPWSSDDEDSDSDTLFRQPNEESDVSNEANEEQRELNSPAWEDEPRATRLGHEQLWALSNDPSRAFREDLQGNPPSDENLEHFPSVGLHSVIKYKRLKRRDGSTFRHAIMRPVSAPMDLRSNVVKVRGVHTSATRVSLPRLSGASIVSLVRERPDVPSDPQPSTSRGIGNPNASNQPSSDTNSIIPTNSLFSHNKRRFISLKPPAFSVPSTSNANRSPFSSTSSALFSAPSDMVQPTLNSERPNAANQPTPGNEQPVPVQTLVPVTAPEDQDETAGETNDIVGRGGQVLDAVVSALQVAIADSGREDTPDFEDAVMDISDVALGLTEQPSQERRAGKRKLGDEGEDNGCVRAFNQALLRLLECPVCLECMEPPITQCRRGHLVCARCRSRLSSCPVCRTPFSSVRNRAMEGVAELLRYPCRHSCGSSVRLRARGAHEASCPARRYRCPAVYCPATAALPLPDLLEHLEKSHSTLIKTGRKHKFSLTMNTKHHDTWLVLIDGDLFSMRVDVDIRSWGIVVYVAYVGPKCNANNFFYEVTVIGQNNERRLTYSRVTHSDLESSSANVARQDCFHLMLDQALNYLRSKEKPGNPDKVLDFFVEINKRKINETPAEDESP